MAEIFAVADGAIVGTSLKVDGDIWNAVDRDRALPPGRRRARGAAPDGGRRDGQEDEGLLRDRPPRVEQVLPQVRQRRAGLRRGRPDPRRRHRRQGPPDDRPRSRAGAGAAGSSGPTTTWRTGPSSRRSRSSSPTTATTRTARSPASSTPDQADGTLDALFVALMHERLSGLAGARRRAPPARRQAALLHARQRRSGELRALLDAAPWGVHDEGRVVMLDDDHEMISWGYSQHHPVAQPPRADRGAARRVDRRRWPRSSGDPARAIFNIHVPPYGIGLDEAPVLDATSGPDVAGTGQVRPGRQHRRPRA